MKTSNRIPKRRYYGQAMQMPMHSLRSQWQVREEIFAQSGYAGKRVLGMKVPYFQRENTKWSLAQKVAFIESIFLGMSLGTYMLNDTEQNPDLDQVLLDGLQRLTAVQEYWENKFAVTGEDGIAYFWNDLTCEEKAHFDRIPFPWVATQYHKLEDAVEAYNRHNFGGVAHTEAERAVVQPQ